MTVENSFESGCTYLQDFMYDKEMEFSKSHGILGRFLVLPIIPTDGALEVIKTISKIVCNALSMVINVVAAPFSSHRSLSNAKDRAISVVSNTANLLVGIPFKLFIQLYKVMKEPSITPSIRWIGQERPSPTYRDKISAEGSKFVDRLEERFDNFVDSIEESKVVDKLEKRFDEFVDSIGKIKIFPESDSRRKHEGIIFLP